MASRDDILRAVRASQPPPRPHPILPSPPERGREAGLSPLAELGEKTLRFAQMVETVGGRCLFVADLGELNRALAELPAYASAKKIVSLVPGAGQDNVNLDTVDDPHKLADVDFAILPGQFGVAENGAVWVTDSGVRHRAIYVLTQHLALVIPAEQIVDNLHQAYERLTFPGPGFGCFISGPSKTADVEQCLVIGAHGPRSLTVFCLS